MVAEFGGLSGTEVAAVVLLSLINKATKCSVRISFKQLVAEQLIPGFRAECGRTCALQRLQHVQGKKKKLPSAGPAGHMPDVKKIPIFCCILGVCQCGG